mgnify:CR=1 FL=1
MKNSLAQEGIKELDELFEVLKYGKYADQVKFDPSKIRGLDIYTGFIVETNLKFEVKNAKIIKIQINKKIKFNLIYNKNNSLDKKIKIEQIRKETRIN